jgi:hypothetical protein
LESLEPQITQLSSDILFALGVLFFVSLGYPEQGISQKGGTKYKSKLGI